MNMKAFILLFILLFGYPVRLQQQDQKQDKLQRNGRPTSLAIDLYINSKTNQNMLIKEFKILVKDSLYCDLYFATRNFKKTTPKEQYDPTVLAYNEQYGNGYCEIVVDNEERYEGFDYKNDKNKDNYNQFSYFVKPTIFHEIMHAYFNQCILEIKMNDTINNYDTINNTIINAPIVNQYYTTTLYTFPNVELQFGAKFIEEGVCEYFTHNEKEAPPVIEYFIPQTVENLKNKTNRFDILYDYSSKFLEDFMKFNTMKYGKIKYPIMILLKNKPPNYNEILNPDLFYKRLKF